MSVRSKKARKILNIDTSFHGADQSLSKSPSKRGSINPNSPNKPPPLFRQKSADEIMDILGAIEDAPKSARGVTAMRRPSFQHSVIKISPETKEGNSPKSPKSPIPITNSPGSGTLKLLSKISPATSSSAQRRRPSISANELFELDKEGITRRNMEEKAIQQQLAREKQMKKAERITREAIEKENKELEDKKKTEARDASVVGEIDEEDDYDDDYEDDDEFLSEEDLDDEDDAKQVDIRAIIESERQLVAEREESLRKSPVPQDSALDVEQQPETPKTPRSPRSDTSSISYPLSPMATFNIKKRPKRKSYQLGMSNAQKLRMQEVSQYVNLSDRNLQIFEKAPVANYEFFLCPPMIAASQYNDDYPEVGLQTEQIGAQEVECQFPDITHSDGSDFIKLRNSIIAAARVCETLVLENAFSGNIFTEMNSEIRQKPDNRFLAIASDRFSLTLPDRLSKGRSVNSLYFSTAEPGLLLSAYSKPILDEKSAASSNGSSIDKCSILAQWDMQMPSRPSNILVSQGNAISCCFSPGRAYLVFAGTEEGSIALWDLREDSSLHSVIDSIVTRNATYTTDFDSDGHRAPIKSLEIVAGESSKTRRVVDPLSASLSQERRVSSFQIASLDETGQAILWSVMELKAADSSGSITELALNIGGRVKLVRAAEIMKPTPLRGVGGLFAGLSLENAGYKFKYLQVEGGGGEFLVTSGSYVVSRIRLLGKPCQPSKYSTEFEYLLEGSKDSRQTIPSNDGFAVMESKQEGETVIDFESNLPFDWILESDPISSFDTCYFYPELFLVGHASGKICLYSVSSSTPLYKWEFGCPGGVTTVRWSPFRNSTFFALDQYGTLFVFNLDENLQAPVFSVPLCLSPEKKPLPTKMFSISSQTGRGEALQIPAIAYPLNSYPSTVEVLIFQPEFSTSKENGEDVIKHLISEEIVK